MDTSLINQVREFRKILSAKQKALLNMADRLDDKTNAEMIRYLRDHANIVGDITLSYVQHFARWLVVE